MKLSLLNTFQKIDTTINYLFGNNFNETKFLKNQFRNKEITFFDIGANLGSEIDFIKKNFKSKIYAFEPDKNNFSYLKKKIFK